MKNSRVNRDSYKLDLNIHPNLNIQPSKNQVNFGATSLKVGLPHSKKFCFKNDEKYFLFHLNFCLDFLVM